MKKNKLNIIAAVIALCTGMLCIMSCKKVLDKADLSAIPENVVWDDINLSTAFLNRLYVDALPGWPANAASESDDAGGGNATMYGQLTVNSVDFWPYANIRSINILLKNVPASSLSAADKNKLVGQALFLRAWQYFQMVSRYGGVPILLEPQELTDELNVSRNKTSECMSQIIKDLDQAASLLPKTWTGENEGRITKGAVLAFKGRVLLHYASEQFDPSQNIAGRWMDAYKANKIALDTLHNQGKGLMPSFQNLWFVEGNANTEAILTIRFNNPGRTHNRDAGVRPLDEAQNATGWDQPSLDLVKTFPMKNGMAISAPGSGYDANGYWKNRDPRFNATVAYNGSLWELSGKTGRIQWCFTGSQQTGATNTGFYCRKAINEAYKPFETEISGVDWIEIRMAEVMLNYAEAANEIGNTNEAYDVLKAIRTRAGIDAGASGLYGLQPGMSKDQMRAAILLERRLEFAFEGKRPQDLRRRRLYSSLNGTKRSKLTIKLIAYNGNKNTFFSEFAAGNVNLNSNYASYFTDTVEDLDISNSINYKDEYYFFAIPLSHLEKNANLKQTKGWDGGTFDPLQ